MDTFPRCAPPPLSYPPPPVPPSAIPLLAAEPGTFAGWLLAGDGLGLFAAGIRGGGHVQCEGSREY